MRVLELGAAWVAYFIVQNWPFSVERRGVGAIYWALLPWAGTWAYRIEGHS